MIKLLPTLEQVVEQVERLTDEASTMRAILAQVIERLLPLGWEAANLTCSSDPRVSMCRDAVSGRWMVWQGPALVATGDTPSGAAAAFAQRKDPA